MLTNPDTNLMKQRTKNTKERDKNRHGENFYSAMEHHGTPEHTLYKGIKMILKDQ